MTLSDVLDRASFDNGSADAEKRFVPSTTFAQHRAAIVDLVVQSPERVLSVDEDRVALLWNAPSGAFIAGYELPAAAILHSIFVASTTTEGESLVPREVAIHQTLQRFVRPPIMATASSAICFRIVRHPTRFM
jgi:hypothetical protein